MRRVLPVVACAALAITACGGGGDESASCKDAVSGSRVEFTYSVDPAKPGESADARRTAAVVCERVRVVKAEGVQVRALSTRRVRVVARDDERSLATADFVARPVAFQFYDWEPNVLGERGPDRPFTGPRALYEATVLASKSKPKAEATDLPSDRGNDTSGTKYYVFNAERRPLRSDGKPLPPGALPRLAERPAAPSRSAVPAGGTVVRVPRGVVVVQAERAPNQPATVQRFFVLEDDSELSGSDIKDAEQSVDPRTNQPVISMKFSEAGRKAFARVTKRVADRGSRTALPPGAPSRQAFQRFAITVDGEILSLPTIDFVANPEGIDGRTGAQIQGLGGVEETRLLAAVLDVGALPAELTLVSLGRRG